MDSSDEILKGNYKVPELEKKVQKPEDQTNSIEHDFEAAALKALGGSITYVKKSGSFIWSGDVKKDE